MKTLTNVLAIATVTLFSAFTSNVNADTGIDAIDNFGDFSKTDTSIIFGGISYHYDAGSHERLNESNPSIGIEMWDLSVVYVDKNSWNNTSFYVTWNPDFYESEYLTIIGNFGVATGYSKDDYVLTENGGRFESNVPTWMGLAPLVGVTASVHLHEHMSVNVTATPSVAMIATAINF